MIDAPTGNDNYTCLACPWRNEAMFSRALSCNVCSLGRGSPFAIGQKAGSEAISLRIHMSYVGQSSDFYLLKIHAITESQTASLDPITGPNLRRSSFTLPSTGSICYPCVIHWIHSNLPSQSWSKLRKCPFTIRLVPAKKPLGYHLGERCHVIVVHTLCKTPKIIPKSSLFVFRFYNCKLTFFTLLSWVINCFCSVEILYTWRFQKNRGTLQSSKSWITMT